MKSSLKISMLVFVLLAGLIYSCSKDHSLNKSEEVNIEKITTILMNSKNYKTLISNSKIETHEVIRIFKEISAGRNVNEFTVDDKEKFKKAITDSRILAVGAKNRKMLLAELPNLSTVNSKDFNEILIITGKNVSKDLSQRKTEEDRSVSDSLYDDCMAGCEVAVTMRIGEIEMGFNSDQIRIETELNDCAWHCQNDSDQYSCNSICSTIYWNEMLRIVAELTAASETTSLVYFACQATCDQMLLKAVDPNSAAARAEVMTPANWYLPFDWK